MIWDNATIHRSDEVKAFLANGWATKIHLENFPAYAPELNPDEGVWQYLKHFDIYWYLIQLEYLVLRG